MTVFERSVERLTEIAKSLERSIERDPGDVGLHVKLDELRARIARLREQESAS